MKPEYESMGSAAIHATEGLTSAHAHLMPIFATSTFTFDSAEQGMKRFAGKEQGFIYSRFGTPTTSAAADAVAALEAFGITSENGAPLSLKAILTSSGQSAMAAMFFANLSAGDTVLTHYSIYGGAMSVEKFSGGMKNKIHTIFKRLLQVGKDVDFMNKQGNRTVKLLGANSNPFDAFLLIQGIKTLELRMKQHCSNALEVAKFLADHKAIARVNYNGLPSHPDHEISAKQMRYPGAVLSFELKEGFEGGKKFIDRLAMCVRAVSLGTVDTLISHPASMSHSGMSREDRIAAGITDGLIRMSVGLEHITDIIKDLEQALSW